MDYINPVSIAQMYQAQKDTSLPGSGYGGVQGFLEGRAGATAEEFLRQSQAAQAQDFVKQQFDMQKAWEDRPFELEKRGAELNNLRQTGKNAELTGQGLKLTNEELARNPKQKQLEHLGSQYEIAAQLKTPLERYQFADALAKKTAFSGLPPMDLDYDGSEQSWQKYLEMLRSAHASSQYTNQLASQRDIAGRRNANDRYISDTTNATRERMNTQDNETQLAGARIAAAAKQASEGGGNKWNLFKAELGEAYKRALTKARTEDAQLTAEDQSILQIAPEILATGYASTLYSKNPEREAAAAGGKTSAEMEEIRKGLKGTVKTDPGKAEPAPLPEREQDLQERLKRY